MPERLVAGIDVGHSTTKIVVLRDGEHVYGDVVKSSLEGDRACKEVEAKALMELGLREGAIEKYAVTGTGARRTKLPNHASKSVVSCLAKAVRQLYPRAMTIIDVGAEMCIVIKLNEQGQVIDIVMNDKCAAGVGIYYEAMAKLAGVSVDQIGSLAVQAENPFDITSTCVVFAEQEVITRVHENPDLPLTEIMGGICNSMARRVSGQTRRAGITEDVVLTGGVTRNEGYVKFLGMALEVNPQVFRSPQLAAAFGAALYAQEESS